MFHFPFLRNLLLLGLAILACLPLYTLLVLHPAYHRQLISDTEADAVRFTNHLVRSLRLEGVMVERERLPGEILGQVQMIMADRKLVKLRFFSPRGEIVYSTDRAEIGNVNTSEAFRNIVGKGEVLSQVVNKDRQTADGVAARLDMIETYVPLLADGRFGGAVEVYYDITARVAEIKELTARTTLTLVLVALGFLGAMLLALNKARGSLQERDRAEAALRQANEELEQRVALRTTELSAANTQLTSEIVERFLAQQALSQSLEETRRQREKVDGILRSVGDGLIVTDDQLTVQHMNAAAEKLLEVPLERALGQPLDGLAGVRDLSKKVRDMLGEGNLAACDFIFPGAGRRHSRVFQVRFSWLNSESGESGVILLLHDVTKERDLDRLKNAFLGMAAHELNTPLAAILGFSELLVSPGSPERLAPKQKDEYLQLIHSKARELSRLVDDLLDISRVEAGQPMALAYQPVRLDELLREALHAIQDRSPRHRFELHCDAKQTEVQLDPGRIRQVLNNLLGNAVKYSPQGGVVKVVAACVDGRCRFSVVDNGIGMTAEQVEHSFDNFYRADSSSTAVRGVGLGMSIVRHIVEAHHGEVRIDSQLGRGTIVHVELPIAPPL